MYVVLRITLQLQQVKKSHSISHANLEYLNPPPNLLLSSVSLSNNFGPKEANMKMDLKLEIGKLSFNKYLDI